MNQNGSVVLKRFIRYLYEYEQEKRMRNVGFVKVEQDEEQCTVHIHGKGMLDGNEKELTLYSFYIQDGQCIGIQLGTIVCSGPALNESWKYTKNDENFTKNFSRINGVILENEQGRRYASVWDDTPADISRMKIFEGDTERGPRREMPEEISEERNDSLERREETGEDRKEDRREEQREDPGEDPGGDSFIVQSEQFPGMSISIPSKKMEFRIRKIQRMEISKLARCEWKLANNNFLMHGYYNYHHLVLLENDSQFMLGVPGIYHEKEKSAAEVFGFPKFISLDELDLTLDPEEKNEDEVFGYWCRPVKRSLRWE